MFPTIQITYPTHGWAPYFLSICPFFGGRGIFNYVAYKQYKLYESETWKRLAQDGIQIMCLVVLCNIIFGVLIILRRSVVGRKCFSSLTCKWFIRSNTTIRLLCYREGFFFTSTILINHCANISRPATLFINSSNKPSRSQSTRMKFNKTVASFQSDVHGVTAYSMFI